MPQVQVGWGPNTTIKNMWDYNTVAQGTGEGTDGQHSG
jgi:hypothetical protein